MHQLTARFWAAALIVTVGWVSLGCTTRKIRKVDPAQVTAQFEEIVGVTTKRGEDVSFESPGGSVKDGNVVGRVRGSDYTIPVSDVQRLWVARVGTSVLRTIGLIAAVTAGTLIVTAAIVVATKQSCPFVYSWDGEKYVFDAEPYGGAITRGLERDDYSELEYLRPSQGLYRLLLTNEVDETQFTNSVELWVVDRAPGVSVTADESGHLHGLVAHENLIAVANRDGKDLLPWLRSTDRVIWEPEAVAARDGSLRDEVVLTFPKPEGGDKAQLIVNAATGLWGSYMIKKIVELRGREAPAWLASMDRDPMVTQALHAWVAQEEIYRLNVEVEEPEGWHVRGTIPPGGPFIAEDRAVSLDVSHARGSRLRIRLRPPLGFWAMNSFAIDYGNEAPVEVTKVKPVLAKTSEGRNVLPELLSSDDRYYAMPKTTDRAEIHFQAPPEKPGMKRTVFLHSRGWYQLHLNTKTEPATDIISRINNTHDGAAQFAAMEYSKWISSRN